MVGKWIDLVVLVFLALGLLKGFKKGLIRELFSLMGAVLAIIVAYHGYQSLALVLLEHYQLSTWQAQNHLLLTACSWDQPVRGLFGYVWSDCRQPHAILGDRSSGWRCFWCGQSGGGGVDRACCFQRCGHCGDQYHTRRVRGTAAAPICCCPMSMIISTIIGQKRSSGRLGCIRLPTLHQPDGTLLEQGFLGSICVPWQQRLDLPKGIELPC